MPLILPRRMPDLQTGLIESTCSTLHILLGVTTRQGKATGLACTCMTSQCISLQVDKASESGIPAPLPFLQSHTPKVQNGDQLAHIACHICFLLAGC